MLVPATRVWVWVWALPRSAAAFTFSPFATAVCSPHPVPQKAMAASAAKANARWIRLPELDFLMNDSSLAVSLILIRHPPHILERTGHDLATVADSTGET